MMMMIMMINGQQMFYQKHCSTARGGLMVKWLDCEIVVREFELQLRYNAHFQTNTLGKGKNSQILQSMS